MHQARGRPIQVRASENMSRATFWGLLSALFIAIVLMAKANALTFPFPNEDEAAFFLPAWSLAVHGSLKPEILNAPNGIYWMPHGYYVWVSFFLWLFGPTIEVARTVNQATTAAAVALDFGPCAYLPVTYLCRGLRVVAGLSSGHYHGKHDKAGELDISALFHCDAAAQPSQIRARCGGAGAGSSGASGADIGRRALYGLAGVSVLRAKVESGGQTVSMDSPLRGGDRRARAGRDRS
jgi:hypothetical protein